MNTFDVVREFSITLPYLSLPVAVLLFTFLLTRAIRFFFNWRLKKLDPVRNVWRHALVAAAGKPVRVLCWLLAALFIERFFAFNEAYPWEPRNFMSTISTLLVVLICWGFLDFVGRAKANYIARANERDETLDHTLIDAVSKITWVAVLAVAALLIFQLLGLSFTGLLAFGGGAGIAVGFAAQTLVANLLGGMTIFASRIFDIGDHIVLPGTQLMGGEVQYIGWRATRVRGWDGRPYYVPNSVFNTTTVINHSRRTHRLINEYIFFSYRDLEKLEDAVREGNAWLQMRADVGYFVYRFHGFDKSAVKLLIYAYVLTSAFDIYSRIKQDILLGLVEIAKDHDCELILPETYVHWRGDFPAVEEPQAVAALDPANS